MTLTNLLYEIINVTNLFIITLIFKNDINSLLNLIINHYHDKFLYKNIILTTKFIYLLAINYLIDNKKKKKRA